MTLNELLINKGYTVYKLSKETKVPKTTIFDIVSGKTNILDCSFGNIIKISKCLNIGVDQMSELEPSLYNPIYEREIPEFLKDSINNIRQGRKNKSTLLDCYLDETNSNINVCEVENLITKEHADYLRKKYLHK